LRENARQRASKFVKNLTCRRFSNAIRECKSHKKLVVQHLAKAPPSRIRIFTIFVRTCLAYVIVSTNCSIILYYCCCCHNNNNNNNNYYYYCYYYYSYYYDCFRLMTIFVGEPGAALGHPALSVPEENLRGLVELIFTDWMSFLPPNHRCQITTKN